MLIGGTFSVNRSEESTFDVWQCMKLTQEYVQWQALV